MKWTCHNPFWLQKSCAWSLSIPISARILRGLALKSLVLGLKGLGPRTLRHRGRDAAERLRRAGLDVAPEESLQEGVGAFEGLKTT